MVRRLGIRDARVAQKALPMLMVRSRRRARDPGRLGGRPGSPISHRSGVRLPDQAAQKRMPKKLSQLLLQHCESAVQSNAPLGRQQRVGLPPQICAVEGQQVVAQQIRPAAQGILFCAGCVHVPAPLQISRVQMLPSSVHGVFTGKNGFAGQVAELPGHKAGPVQTPAARHWVPAALNWFGGQSSEVPLHASARSQTPAAARHWVPAAFGPIPHLPLTQVACAHSWDAGGAGQVAGVVHSGAATQVPA